MIFQTTLPQEWGDTAINSNNPFMSSTIKTQMRHFGSANSLVQLSNSCSGALLDCRKSFLLLPWTLAQVPVEFAVLDYSLIQSFITSGNPPGTRFWAVSRGEELNWTFDNWCKNSLSCLDRKAGTLAGSAWLSTDTKLISSTEKSFQKCT